VFFFFILFLSIQCKVSHKVAVVPWVVQLHHVPVIPGWQFLPVIGTVPLLSYLQGGNLAPVSVVDIEHHVLVLRGTARAPFVQVSISVRGEVVRYAHVYVLKVTTGSGRTAVAVRYRYRI